MFNPLRTLTAVGLLVAVAAPLMAQGLYTSEQAARGRQIYTTYCVTCHGADLEGGVAPALGGATFLHKWGGENRSIDDLYYVLRTNMPRPAAGSLTPKAYASVFAYILERNGVQAGTREFDGSQDMLKAVPFSALALAAGPAPSVAPMSIEGVRRKPLGKGPAQSELLAPDAADWLYHTGNYAGTRYSPLDQITTANVGSLKVSCALQVGPVETFYSGPIVHHGIMYLTTANTTVAVDAATCRERWRYEWKPQDEMLWPNNRGVAVKDGYVVRGTADGYLVALDAEDGALLWARHVASPGEGETITMPPMIFEDLVLIGPAGSENNIQGWIGAFKLSSGEPVWRFNTVPRPGEPGRETWPTTPGVPNGGGAVWTPLSLDAARGELYVAVTNPAPDLPAHLRPGANLYTNAAVALDVRTGKLRWYDQLVPSDFHDWDLTQVSPLIRARVAGKDRDLLITSGKDGLLHAIDRRTRERLYQAEVTTRRNVDAPLSKDPVEACPGLLGGVEWNGPAYDPGAGLLIVPAVDWCFRMALMDTVRHVPGEMYLGGTFEGAEQKQGWLTAVDARDGSIRWRYRSELPMTAAVTTTAGGVAFTGEQTGDFLAFESATGRELYRFHTGAGIFGGVVTYAVGARQYVATTSGGGSLTMGGGGAPILFVFELPR